MRCTLSISSGEVFSTSSFMLRLYRASRLSGSMSIGLWPLAISILPGRAGPTVQRHPHCQTCIVSYFPAPFLPILCILHTHIRNHPRPRLRDAGAADGVGGVHVVGPPCVVQLSDWSGWRPDGCSGLEVQGEGDDGVEGCGCECFSEDTGVLYTDVDLYG